MTKELLAKTVWLEKRIPELKKLKRLTKEQKSLILLSDKTNKDADVKRVAAPKIKKR